MIRISKHAPFLCLNKLSKCVDIFQSLNIVHGSDSSVESTLQVVQIYFDTATYDEIERDVKVISSLMVLYVITYHLWIR